MPGALHEVGLHRRLYGIRIQNRLDQLASEARQRTIRARRAEDRVRTFSPLRNREGPAASERGDVTGFQPSRLPKVAARAFQAPPPVALPGFTRRAATVTSTRAS